MRSESVRRPDGSAVGCDFGRSDRFRNDGTWARVGFRIEGGRRCLFVPNTATETADETPEPPAESIMRTPAVRRLVGASAFSSLGSAMVAVAMAFVAFRESGSVVLTVLVLAANAAPAAAALADRREAGDRPRPANGRRDRSGREGRHRRNARSHRLRRRAHLRGAPDRQPRERHRLRADRAGLAPDHPDERTRGSARRSHRRDQQRVLHRHDHRRAGRRHHRRGDRHRVRVRLQRVARTSRSSSRSGGRREFRRSRERERRTVRRGISIVKRTDTLRRAFVLAAVLNLAAWPVLSILPAAAHDIDARAHVLGLLTGAFFAGAAAVSWAVVQLRRRFSYGTILFAGFFGAGLLLCANAALTAWRTPGYDAVFVAATHAAPDRAGRRAQLVAAPGARAARHPQGGPGAGPRRLRDGHHDRHADRRSPHRSHRRRAVALGRARRLGRVADGPGAVPSDAAARVR